MHGRGAGSLATRVYKAGAGHRRIIVAPHRSAGGQGRGGPAGAEGARAGGGARGGRPRRGGRKRGGGGEGGAAGGGRGRRGGRVLGQDGRLMPLPSLLLDTRGWGTDRKTPRLFTVMALGMPRLGL